MENGTNSAGGGGGGSGERQSHRLPLSDVVSDCLRRWFQDTLKEAKAGDLSMQVLVAQMYFNGYGIPKDHQKARIWMTRAARVRSSVWRVSSKRPGYNASDSDSEELLDDS
ncbi:putative tetratricopeptide-like helical domain superfamily [Helianthus debilis subsp. tardiflorus]